VLGFERFMVTRYHVSVGVAVRGENIERLGPTNANYLC
jgi:hypothetical protein